MKKLLIGGQALVQMGSSRGTKDVDYLINDTTSKLPFSHDITKNIDYINANGNKFFAEIWKMEANNNSGIASPQAILELKAYSLVQHCINRNWSKVADCEYDIAFLVREFNCTIPVIVKKHVTAGQYDEIIKEINSVRK